MNSSIFIFPDKKHFPRYIFIFISIIFVSLSCDPLFFSGFWLCDAEISLIANTGKKLLPFIIFGSFAILAIYKHCHLTWGAFFLMPLFYLPGIFSSIINQIELGRALYVLEYTAAIGLYAVICCQDDYSKKLFIRLNADMFIVLALANIIFVKILLVAHPDYINLTGQWHEAFVTSSHNSCGFIFFIGMLYNLLDNHINSKSFRLPLFALLFALNIWACSSATFIVGGVILLCYIVFPFIRKLIEKLDFIYIIALEALLFVMLIFCFDFFTSLPPVKLLVENLLHKEITFTGRVFIWEGVLADIKSNPLTGYGMIASSFYYDDIFNHCYTHCHNQYLQSWHEGGILGLILPFIALLLTAGKLNRCDDKRLSGIFKIVFLAILTTLQTDQLSTTPWYIVFITVNLAYIFISDSSKSIGDNIEHSRAF